VVETIPKEIYALHKELAALSFHGSTNLKRLTPEMASLKQLQHLDLGKCNGLEHPFPDLSAIPGLTKDTVLVEVVEWANAGCRATLQPFAGITEVITAEGAAPVTLAEVAKGKAFVLALFSSGSVRCSSPDTRAFTPELVRWFESGGQAQAQVVFVSLDSTEALFSASFQSMPWLAVPYAQRGSVKPGVLQRPIADPHALPCQRRGSPAGRRSRGYHALGRGLFLGLGPGVLCEHDYND